MALNLAAFVFFTAVAAFAVVLWVALLMIWHRASTFVLVIRR